MSFTPLNQPGNVNSTSTSTMTPDSVNEMDPQVNEHEHERDVVRYFLLHTTQMKRANICIQDKSPATPRKRGRGKKQDPGSGEEDKTPSKKSKSPKKSGPLGPTPMTYEEATETDKLIIRMKEVDLKGWSEIQKVVEDATGAKMGGTSTIRMRYTRMKSNFVVFEKDNVGSRCS